MGIKLKRLKGVSKANANTWKKGQSCISNPPSKKHRKLASQGFFKKIENSRLTEDAIAKHENMFSSLASAGTSKSVQSHASSVPSISLTVCPSSLYMPTVASTAEISIGYNPPSDAITVTAFQKDMEEMSLDEDDLKSQAKTFASRYTTCSLPAFENFFSKLSVQSEHQVMMLSFHAAVQDIIKGKSLPETPSSYFVAIIMSLEGFLAEPDQVCAGLALLVRVIKSVPLAVLQTKCDKFGEVLNTVITTYQDSDNVQLLSHVLGCLSILLRAQHLASWYRDDTLKTWLKNILVFTLRQEPKVRKSGQYNVSAVLKGSQFMVTCPLRPEIDKDSESNVEAEPSQQPGNGSGEAKATATKGVSSDALEVHPAADLVADFLIGQLKPSGSTAAANRSVVHMLVFTRQVIMSIPKHKLQVLIHRLFSLVSLGRGLINTLVLQCLQALCTARPPPSVLPLSLTTSLLNTITRHSPGVSSAVMASLHDPASTRTWASVGTVVVMHAIRLDVGAGIGCAGDWCKTALLYWRSDNVQVLLAMEESLSAVLSSVYDAMSTETCSFFEAGVRVIVVQLEAALSYQCQAAWPCVFRLLGQCYTELGLYFAPLMMPSLKTLCELMANNSLAASGDLEKAIGRAVQGLGVEAVIFSALVDITGDITKDEKNLWVLPILRKFVRGSRLVFYKDHFVPLAEKCFNVVSTLQKEKTPNSRLVATYKTVEYQIWAMLPSFANDAQDVEEAQTNKTFAQLVCRLIEHSDSSRIDAMAALRHMITADGTSTGRLAKNANNYLPALFNLYVREPKNAKNMDKADVIENSHRLAALATINAYLKIVPETQCQKSMEAILSKYKAETGKHRKRSLLNLARCFVPYVKGSLVLELFQLVTPLITAAKDKRAQKAAYRVLEEVLGAHSVGTQEFIDEHLPALSDLLLQSVSTAAASSRAPRLRCAKVVLETVSSSADTESSGDLLQRVVAEAVMCCGRINSTATKKAAIALLTALPGALQRIKQLDDDTTVRECMRLLAGGLLGRDTLRANTILAITAYTFHAKDMMPVDVLAQNVTVMSQLLECRSREVVQACLSFLKGVTALYPVAVLGPLVRPIVGGIVGMTGDCAKTYRLKTRNILARLMRKFGDDYITKLVPAKNVILHKRLRNLRKEASRQRRQRNTEESDSGEEEGTGDLHTEKAPTSLEEILAEIDPDLAGADEDDSKASCSRRRSASKPVTAWIAEDDSGDEILDLLGEDAARSVMTKKPCNSFATVAKTNKDKDKDNKNGGFAVDPVSGKLIIVEDPKEEKLERNPNQLDMDDVEDALFMKSKAMSGRITERKRARPDSDSNDEDSSVMPLSKRSNRKDSFDYGSEFRSKKGRGDVMRKGQTQKPYAYIQLSRDRLNRRKQAKFAGQFKSVVKGAKKGARQGTKLRKSGKKNRL